MCTSSMMYILYLPTCGGMRTCSIKVRMSSTKLLDAASSSWMEKDVPFANDSQLAHVPHASTSPVICSQLMVLANMRAQLVLPTPRGPQNRKACANWLFLIAFLSVPVMCCCPTTVSKVAGRYFLAETIKLSIATKIRFSLIKRIVYYALSYHMA